MTQIKSIHITNIHPLQRYCAIVNLKGKPGKFHYTASYYKNEKEKGGWY
ncbi:MAG: hypothetical protein K2Z81_20855 [Cyanobacteria bacterium]|nr:hypothetical protein [Cyanobacteriota bacterium]